MNEIDAFIKELNDDEATIFMVDSNMYRERILPSERAFAYKMKLEAIKHQGKKLDTSTTGVSKLRSDEIIARENPTWQNAIFGSDIVNHIYSFKEKYPTFNVTIDDYWNWQNIRPDPLDIDENEVVNPKFHCCGIPYFTRGDLNEFNNSIKSYIYLFLQDMEKI